MARNNARREQLADAAIAVVADEGMRGLTHRAVDVRAGAPLGTASNYFRSRDALIDAIVAQIGQRLTPSAEVHQELAARTPGTALFADYLRDIVRRLLGDRQVTLALFTLRLEAARNPMVADRLGQWIRAGFEADVAFNRNAGLPGDAFDIALFHYAIDGLILDRLTLPIDAETSTDTVVDAFVAGLLRDRMSP
ncbi:TetR/AcrR family transcriptional regulator [Microbacterium flavescens]|uniref:TetR/AcrR family transcriptional regulator n=1 Tax=Microbacterium flavescens TaxID=69366 RepID=UPI001BDE46AF|nr:TetR/AcrR family transcriptional regulator [Microbacterium flavescens]BFF12421.1 TetR/AcrR family transcriptional regulator [Microbacterium flavescens]